MTYDFSSREIVIKLKTIHDLINVNGIHPMKITIKDSKNGKNEYQFIFSFLIPDTKVPKVQEENEIYRRNGILNATIDSISDMGLM